MAYLEAAPPSVRSCRIMALQAAPCRPNIEDDDHSFRSASVAVWHRATRRRPAAQAGNGQIGDEIALYRAQAGPQRRLVLGRAARWSTICRDTSAALQLFLYVGTILAIVDEIARRLGAPVRRSRPARWTASLVVRSGCRPRRRRRMRRHFFSEIRANGPRNRLSSPALATLMVVKRLC